MPAKRLLFLFMATAVAGGTAACPASACVFTAPICIGDAKFCHPSPSQKRANERRLSNDLTLQRAVEARKRLAAGDVDIAAELAELLIPNVRPIQIQRSDCGIVGESDYADGEETEDALFQAMVAGTALAGTTPAEFARVLRRST